MMVRPLFNVNILSGNGIVFDNTGTLYIDNIKFNMPSGELNVKNCSLRNSIGEGGAEFNAYIENGNIDRGGNIGWNFGSSSPSLYWVGNGGNWNDPNHWSLKSGGIGGVGVPTSENIAVFDSNSITLEDQEILFPTNETNYLLSLDMTDLQYKITLNSITSPFIVKQIECGGEYTMILSNSGDVHGWGLNDTRQVNPASRKDHWTDTSTVILSGVKQISCGYYYTMVLMENGDVHGWGANWAKQVNPNSSYEYWTDVSTVILSGVKQISCGSDHTMVLMENGDVHGWGANWNKQVNPNSDNDLWVDTSTVILSGVKQISCGANEYTMVLMENGDVHGWGANWNKQVNPLSEEDEDFWTDVSTVILSGVKQISCGGENTMVLMENGDVHGWGANWNKQLNPNSDNDLWVDTSTVILSGVKQISCGYYHTMVLMENGDVHGWGINWNKQVNPNSSYEYWTDTSTVILSGVKQISCGADHTMVLMENEDVHGWGANWNKQVNPSEEEDWSDYTLVNIYDIEIWTLSIESGTINAYNSIIKNSIAEGGAIFNAFESNNNIDGGNNTGWFFGYRTRYWINNTPTYASYDFHDSENWSLTSGGDSGASPPTEATDTAIFDENSVSEGLDHSSIIILLEKPQLCHIQIDSDCSAISFILLNEWSLREDISDIGGICLDSARAIFNSNNHNISLCMFDINFGEADLGSSVLTISPKQHLSYPYGGRLTNLDVLKSSLSTIKIYPLTDSVYINGILTFSNLEIEGDGRILFGHNSEITILECSLTGDTEGGLYLGWEVFN